MQKNNLAYYRTAKIEESREVAKILMFIIQGNHCGKMLRMAAELLLHCCKSMLMQSKHKELLA